MSSSDEVNVEFTGAHGGTGVEAWKGDVSMKMKAEDGYLVVFSISGHPEAKQ